MTILKTNKSEIQTRAIQKPTITTSTTKKKAITKTAVTTTNTYTKTLSTTMTTTTTVTTTTITTTTSSTITNTTTTTTTATAGIYLECDSAEDVVLVEFGWSSMRVNDGAIYPFSFATIFALHENCKKQKTERKKGKFLYVNQ